MTTCERVANMPSSRISPSLACTRRRRSQSIPAELAAPSAGPLSERPAGCTPGRETRDADAVNQNRGEGIVSVKVAEQFFSCEKFPS